MSSRVFRPFVWSGLAACLATSVSAATLQPADIMQQFNVVTSGDLISTQEVEGRAYIGGNLSGSNIQVDFEPSVASDFADLIVIGNSTVNNINLQNQSDSDVVIGGTNGSTINNTGPTSEIIIGSLPSALVPMSPVQVLTDLSEELSKVASNAVEAVTGQSNLLRLNAAATDGVTVYDLDIADLNRGGIEVDLNGADLVVINVSGEGSINSNFQGGGLADFAKKAIWNFGDATELTFKQFYGQVLAPNADVTNTSPIEGFLFANDVTLNGEIHLQSFSGDLTSFEDELPAVPLPAGLPMLLAGLAGFGLLRRRRH